tara:strand:+ start:1364 stop:3754 length:2391 start_codon:yes stop_codon:yes gene_type:complete
MANKYSNFQFQPYVSTFVDPQSVEIQKILRNRWEKNRSNYDLMSTALASEQVGTSDQWIKDAALDDVNNQFAGAIKRNNWEDHTTTVSNATNSWLTNEGLNLAKQSYKVHEEEEAMKAKIRMEKGPNAILFDWEFAKDPNSEDGFARDANGNLVKQDKFANHRSYYTDENGTVVRNPYRMTSEMMGDWNAAQNSMITQIKSDPLWGGRLADALKVIDPTNATGITDQDIAMYMQTGKLMGASGVTSEKVAVIAQGLAQAYATSSPEGQQQMRALMEQRINDKTGLPFTAEEATQQMAQQFYAKMQGQVGSEVKYFDNKLLLDAYKNQTSFGGLQNPFENVIKDKRVFPASNQEDAMDFMFDKNKQLKPGKLKNFDATGNYVFDGYDPSGDSSREGYLNILSQQVRDDLAATMADPNLSDEEKLKQNNRRYIKAHEDQYIAYLLTEYADMRKAYKNDKDFVTALYAGRSDAKSHVHDLYGLNMPVNFSLAAEQVAGMYTKTTAAFRTHNGEVVTGVLGSGVTPGLPDNQSGILDALANHYAFKEKGQLTGLNLGGSSNSKKHKGTAGNNSGVNYKKTKNLINAAIQDPNNWSIYAMNPGGVSGKTGSTWVAKINVPTSKELKMKGSSNPFAIELEMEMPDNMQVFDLSGNIFKDIMNTRFNNTHEEYMGMTKIQGQDVVQIGELSYVPGNPDDPSEGIQPLLRVNYFNVEDINPETGLPLRDNEGNLTVQPVMIRNEAVTTEDGQEAYDNSRFTNQVYGQDVLKIIREGEINALRNHPLFYMEKYTKTTGEEKYPGN